MINNKIKYWLIGIASSIALFFLFGIPTKLIPNPWFARMIPATTYDYLYLVLSSILLGAYIGIHYYKKNESSVACTVGVTAGGIGGFLAFGCPICNQILVILFGATALLTYLEPYRPILGLVSIVVLSFAVIYRLKAD